MRASQSAGGELKLPKFLRPGAELDRTIAIKHCTRHYQVILPPRPADRQSRSSSLAKQPCRGNRQWNHRAFCLYTIFYAVARTNVDGYVNSVISDLWYNVRLIRLGGLYCAGRVLVGTVVRVRMGVRRAPCRCQCSWTRFTPSSNSVFCSISATGPSATSRCDSLKTRARSAMSGTICRSCVAITSDLPAAWSLRTARPASTVSAGPGRSWVCPAAALPG